MPTVSAPRSLRHPHRTLACPHGAGFRTQCTLRGRLRGTNGTYVWDLSLAHLGEWNLFAFCFGREGFRAEGHRGAGWGVHIDWEDEEQSWSWGITPVAAETSHVVVGEFSHLVARGIIDESHERNCFFFFPFFLREVLVMGITKTQKL